MRATYLAHLVPFYFITLAQWYSAGLRTGWMIGGSSPGRGWENFSLPPRPELLWDPSILLPNGYQGSFPGSKAAEAWSWPLTSI
jgi:hypothetical protein